MKLTERQDAKLREWLHMVADAWQEDGPHRQIAYNRFKGWFERTLSSAVVKDRQRTMRILNKARLPDAILSDVRKEILSGKESS